MEKVIVQPTLGFANINFGMLRDEVRHNFTGFKGEFKKTPFDTQCTDDFGFCHVFYDDGNKCEAVEFFPEIEVQVNGQTILPGQIEDLKKVIPDLSEIEEGCWISKNSSMGVTSSNGHIESILFGKPNYYM